MMHNININEGDAVTIYINGQPVGVLVHTETNMTQEFIDGKWQVSEQYKQYKLTGAGISVSDGSPFGMQVSLGMVSSTSTSADGADANPEIAAIKTAAAIAKTWRRIF